MDKEKQHHTELSAVYGNIDGIEDGRVFLPEAELSYEDELTQFILTSLRTAMHDGVKTVALPAVSFAESESDDDAARIAVHKKKTREALIYKASRFTCLQNACIFENFSNYAACRSFLAHACIL